jgi:hypothetical protein
MKRTITLSFALIMMLSLRAQTIEGDALVSIVGSKVDDPTTQKFFAAYEVKTNDGFKYSSEKKGLDLETKNGIIKSMTVYQSSMMYGEFTNKLPKGAKFGTTTAEVIKTAGKPTTSYISSGYTEYEVGKYVLSYWFEEGKLNQVTISFK